MLKRSRAPSPSPTRADPSSPPPLDDNPCLPLPKRRRIVGPVIDSMERRDGATEDDGEDDEDPDFPKAADRTHIPNPDDKIYEHVNRFLHGLHEEQRHRSRPGPTHSDLSSHATGPSTFISPRDSPSPFLSPLSTPVKYVRDSQHHSSPMFSAQYLDRSNPQEMQDNIRECSNPVHDAALATPGQAENKVEDERYRVTQRYEDTNRLLGSLVLSRRRPMRSPSAEIE